MEFIVDRLFFYSDSKYFPFIFLNLLSVTDGISRLPLSTLNCDQRLLPFVDFNSF